MNRAIVLVVVSLMLIAGGTKCSTITTNPPETHPAGSPAVELDGGVLVSPTSPSVQETRPATAMLMTNLIGELIKHPDRFIGQQVEVIGFFRGWDLLKEVKGSSPVTRSDWVIADSSGAIYVTGIIPPNLDPASLKDTGKVIRLVATVEQNQNGTYLRAVSVEVISTE